MNTYYEKPLINIGKRIFVFGSNTYGRHGKGAALIALKYYGAIYKRGIGHVRQSYAIPTKDGRDLSVLGLDKIKEHVEAFKTYTLVNPHLSFYVTPVGTGLAGYKHEEIAPMFRGCVNCMFPLEWKPYLD